jgi:hypothetical protein
MNPQKVIFWILIFIATVIGLFQFRTSEEVTKQKEESNKQLKVSIIDIKQSPPNDLRTYTAEIVIDSPTRLVFNQFLRVVIPYYFDRDAVCAYSYDRTTGIGTWTQTFPESNGTFQMFPEGEGFRIVQSRANGEFLTEALLIYSYQ